MPSGCLSEHTVASRQSLLLLYSLLVRGALVPSVINCEDVYLSILLPGGVSLYYSILLLSTFALCTIYYFV